MPDMFEPDWYEMQPGVFRQIMSVGEKLMNIRIRFKPGAIVPLHSHFHEQISYVIEGHLQFTIGETQVRVSPGESVHIPSNVTHGCVAEDDVFVIDTFNPPREDYLAQVKL